MLEDIEPAGVQVHCRTGSLENALIAVISNGMVHCRTGSLENDSDHREHQRGVHCRTGSLEIYPHERRVHR